MRKWKGENRCLANWIIATINIFVLTVKTVLVYAVLLCHLQHRQILLLTKKKEFHAETCKRKTTAEFTQTFD